MFFLVVLLLTISLVGALRKCIFAPHIAFSIIWTLLLLTFLINQHLFFPISIKASLLIFTGCASFIFGSFVMTRRIKSNSRSQSISQEIRSGYYTVFALLTIAALISTAIENIGYLAMGMDFNEILIKKAGEEETSRGFFLTVISMFIAVPFVYVSVPVLGLELCRKKKRWWIIVLAVLIEVLYVLQSARRSMLIYIMPALFYIIISNRQFLLSNKEKRKMIYFFIILSAVIIVGISWLSFQRETSFQETGKEYVAGCFPSFSERIEKCDTWYLGAGTLHGLLVPIMIGRNFFVHSYPEWWLKLDYLVEAPDSIQIGPNAYVNAFNTMFYIPYLDFGFLGILLISLIVGVIYGRAYRKVVMRPSSRNRAIFSVLLIGLVGSLYTLYFTQSPYMLSFFYLYFLFRK